MFSLIIEYDDVGLILYSVKQTIRHIYRVSITLHHCHLGVLWSESVALRQLIIDQLKKHMHNMYYHVFNSINCHLE